VQLIESLVGAIARHSPAGAAWLQTEGSRFPQAFAAAGRTLGRDEISVEDCPIPWPRTGADEVGRAALVLGAVAVLPPDQHVTFVRDLLRRGEVRERHAVLRVLAGLPEPVRFLDLAIDAFRTNVQSVFEALACDNAYPARYFTSAQFAQLVIKALLTGAPVGRIHELSSRIDAELVRMVEAYASERRAAGRPVPEDAKLILQ